MTCGRERIGRPFWPAPPRSFFWPETVLDVLRVLERAAGIHLDTSAVGFLKYFEEGKRLKIWPGLDSPLMEQPLDMGLERDSGMVAVAFVQNRPRLTTDLRPGCRTRTDRQAVGRPDGDRRVAGACPFEASAMTWG